MTESAQEVPSHLLQRLAELEINAEPLDYPAHMTVEEGKKLRGDMSGTFTKNLFLKDKKGKLFLVTLEEDQSIDLGRLHKRLPAQGRLSFVSKDKVIDYLGVLPGTVTPLALINDMHHQVTLVLDETLMHSHEINMHPLVNAKRILLSPSQLLTFVQSCGRSPIILDFKHS